MQTLRSKVDMLKGLQLQAQSELDKAKAAYVKAVRALDMTEEARIVIQKLANETRNEVIFHVTETGTSILNATLGKDWALRLSFSDPEEQKRSDAWLEFMRGPNGGQPTDPVEEDSGGACYEAAFGLKVANLKTTRPKLRPSLFLDEPGGNLNNEVGSRELSENFADTVHAISETGVQFLIVSTMPELFEVADKVFSC